MSTPPPENFEQVSKRLRSLARSLTRDEAGAEDLVQETWKVALDTPRARVRDGAAWMAGVLRRLARRRTTVERRRRQIEELASHPEQLDEARILEHVDTYRWLRASVEDLAEPYRTVLRLRFFGDLGHREIAAELGRPLETVRSQAQRGIELLRTRLDPDRNGPDWRAALAWWPGRGTPVHRPRLVLALLALGLTGLAVHLGLRAGAGDSGSTSASLDPGSASTQGPTAPPATPSSPDQGGEREPVGAAPSGSPPPSAPTTTAVPLVCRVRVVDELGRGVPDAEVRLCGGRDTLSFLPEARRADVIAGWPYSVGSRVAALRQEGTDATGRVRFIVDPEWIGDLGHGIHGVILVASHRTLGSSDRALLDWGSGTPPELELVLDKPGAEVRIQVANDRTEDIAGASVLMVPRSLRAPRQGEGVRWVTEVPWSPTDALGLGTLPGVPPGTHELRVFKKGFQSHSRLVEIQPEPADFQVTLSPGATLRGRITRTSGEPVAGARIWSSGSRHVGKALTQSDAQGEYELIGVPPGRRYVHVDDGQGSGADARLEIEAGETIDWNPTVAELEVTELEVVTPAGIPPTQGSSLAILATVEGEVWMLNQLLDPEGRATLAHLPEESKTLVILTPEASALGRSALEMAWPEPPPASLRLELEGIEDPNEQAGIRARIAGTESGSEGTLWVEVLAHGGSELHRGEVDPGSRLVEVLGLRPGSYRVRIVSGSAGCLPLRSVELQAGELLDLGDLATPAPRATDAIPIELEGLRGRLEQRLPDDPAHVLNPDCGPPLPPLFPGSYRWVPRGDRPAVEFEVP